MFTGIVEEIGQVISAADNRLVIAAPKICPKLQPGDSVDVNGACLTVTEFDRASFSVDVMEETLERTTLGRLKSGDRVNLETALTLQKPLGGHLVQGHVDTTGEVESLVKHVESTVVRLATPPDIMYYVVEKGFIAVNGISLTVTGRDERGFDVSIVKFSMQNTNLSDLKVGDQVNLEADIIAKYVEQLQTKATEAISMDFLQQHGFLDS
jgi:riboflavin synthase